MPPASATPPFQSQHTEPGRVRGVRMQELLSLLGMPSVWQVRLERTARPASAAIGMVGFRWTNAPEAPRFAGPGDGEGRVARR